MTAKTFSPEDFVKALSSESLKQPIVLAGLAKKAEQPNAILFSPETSCHNWVPIPLDRIEKVEWLGKLSCKDHEHDHVKLFLKESEKGKGDFYADLLRVFTASAGQSPCFPMGQSDQVTPIGPFESPGIADFPEAIANQFGFGGSLSLNAAIPISRYCWELHCFKASHVPRICLWFNRCTGKYL